MNNFMFHYLVLALIGCVGGLIISISIRLILRQVFRIEEDFLVYLITAGITGSIAGLYFIKRVKN